jgi:hypothetical protein
LKQTTKLRSYDLQSHGVEVIEEYDEKLPAVMGVRSSCSKFS